MHRIMCSVEAALEKTIPEVARSKMSSTIFPTDAVSSTQKKGKGRAREVSEATTQEPSGDSASSQRRKFVNGAEDPPANANTAPVVWKKNKHKGKETARQSSRTTSSLPSEESRPSEKRKYTSSTEEPSAESESARERRKDKARRSCFLKCDF